ncbi:CocE/NonD family hydrolase [Streptomyces wuyuanensis]|uniref:CocE/NonD family hydrolase n=1 Tax=Streptomyces wuyuanensis TaxID=1196353 RepID=UPI003425F26F
MLAGVEIEFDLPAPMRDGAVLFADVYRPHDGGVFPVLLARTPYGKQALPAVLDPVGLARHGYIVVLQDVRGRNKSEGLWSPLAHEGPDGYDSVRWAARLPGSNGSVGLLGGSYLGNVQWMAAASSPPELKVLTPSVTWCDPHNGLWTRGGATELGLGMYWSLLQGVDFLAREHSDDPAQRTARIRALVDDLDTLAQRGYWELPAVPSPVIARHHVPDLGHERVRIDPDAANDTRVAGRHQHIHLPSLHIGGWYDAFCQGVLDNYTAMAAAGQPARLVMGPWEHTTNYASGVGEADYGTAASGAFLDLNTSLAALRLNWLDRWLKPDTPRNDDGAPVKIFVMGANRWRDEESWPLARSVETPFHLHAGGGLSQHRPRPDEEPARYAYDPADPVPTHGGALLMASGYPAGPRDQREIEARPDVLVYTSEPLAEDLEVTGRISLLLHAATDAPSTDWVARLCDVDTHGKSLNITDGIIRTHGTPGTAVEHHIDLWSTSTVVRAGHRLRVHITSSSFPRWDRNLNTGRGQATTMRTARQTVFHDAARPTRIMLPITPTT